VKANHTTSETTPRSRRVRRSAAVGVVALFALSACTSDPGAKRVAQDIIEAESLRIDEAIASGENLVPLDEECMLDVLDDFGKDELTDVANQLNSGDTSAQEEGAEALALFEAALDSCN